ncbi:bifunctional protein [Bordetella pertussis]|nr:bifunctional protein [Bordetella pertussis]
MKKWRGILGACALLIGSAAAAQVQDMPGGPRVNQLNLHEGVTQISRDVVWLHWMMLAICIVIFIGVFGVMFYSIWAHRKSRGHKAATFHEHLGVEVAWTVIPFLIVIAMALPATKTVVAMKDTSSADVTVKVTGYQWKWGYEYLDGEAAGIKFLSTLSTPRAQIENREPKGQFYLMEVDNHMVVPVDKKVRVVLTAGDVIHSWMVPDFGVKQDAIPGFLRDAWFRAEKPGIYRGQCAELCGKDHAFMPIVVEVLAQPEYDKWVADQKKKMAASADDPTRNGRRPNWLRAARRCLPPIAWPVTRPTARAFRARSLRLTAIPSCWAPRPRRSIPCSRASRHRHGGVRRPAQRCRSRSGHHLHAQCLEQCRQGPGPGGPTQGRGGGALKRAPLLFL